jgi:RES domain-containing protein
MIVYRFTAAQYREDITGNGARLFGGRWNSKGVPVLYTSNHISLSVLELLVHNKNYSTYKDPFLVSISIPDTIIPVVTLAEKLTGGWNNKIAYTRWIGDQFLRVNNSLVLQVPSSIIPQEHNLLVNPLHTDFKKVKIVATELFELDRRLLHQPSITG